jgi:TRAP transporter TAXI family solute receptor
LGKHSILGGMMKRIHTRLLLVGAVTVLLAIATLVSAQRRFISIGGGSTGGTFNTFSSGIGDYLGQNISGLNITVEGSAGSAENIRRIQGGDMEMGIAFAGDAFLAFNGLDAFAEGGPYDNIRAVGFLYSAVSQIVTLEETGITTIADLAGKTVAVGGAGSGTQLSIERLLTEAGIYDSITPVLVAGQNASAQLKDRQVVAYHALFGVPNASVTDTASTNNIVILSSYDDAAAVGFFDKYPFYTRYVIPAGTFNGQDEDVITWRDAGLLIVSADMDEDLVYEMTQTIYGEEGLAHMLQVTSVAKEMGPENALVGIQIPLHAGAAKYWQEAGVEIPDIAQPQ